MTRGATTALLCSLLVASQLVTFPRRAFGQYGGDFGSSLSFQDFQQLVYSSTSVTTITTFSFSYTVIVQVSISEFDRRGFRDACAASAGVSSLYVSITNVQSVSFSSFGGRHLMQGDATQVTAQIAFPQGQQSQADAFQQKLNSDPSSVVGKHAVARDVQRPQQQQLTGRQLPNGQIIPQNILNDPAAQGVSLPDVVSKAGANPQQLADVARQRGTLPSNVAQKLGQQQQSPQQQQQKQQQQEQTQQQQPQQQPGGQQQQQQPYQGGQPQRQQNGAGIGFQRMSNNNNNGPEFTQQQQQPQQSFEQQPQQQQSRQEMQQPQVQAQQLRRPVGP